MKIKNLILLFIVTICTISNFSYAQIIRKTARTTPSVAFNYIINSGVIKGVIYDTNHQFTMDRVVCPSKPLPNKLSPYLFFELRELVDNPPSKGLNTGKTLKPIKAVLQYTLTPRDDISWNFEITGVPIGKNYLLFFTRIEGYPSQYFPPNVGLNGSATFDISNYPATKDIFMIALSPNTGSNVAEKNVEIIKLISPTPPK